MNKISISNYFLILILGLLLISCDLPLSNTSNRQKIDEIDTSGRGLEFNFDLGTEWINNKLISYSLDLKNSGLKDIKLSRDNVRLTTTEIISGEDVVNGFDDFYSKLFKNGDLILYHDLDVDSIVSGNFEIKDDYFKDLTKESLEINLEINYDYSTDFSNNIEIDMNKKTMKVLNSVSQAAPINIYKYKLIPTSQEGLYQIGIYIKDNGINSQITRKEITFTDVNFKLGTTLLSDCSIWDSTGGESIKISDSLNLEKMRLNSNRKSLIIVCNVDLSDFSSSEVRNTIVSGNLAYNYDLFSSQKIRLPKKRTSTNAEW